MRILVISDVHANFTALEAVLEDAGSVDETWCLGDLVGYGPDPNAVVDHVRDLPHLTCILGNHDVAAIGRMPIQAFNNDARHSLIWTMKVLSTDNVDFLCTLQEDATVRGDVTLVHGSPRDPIWEYVLNTLSARLNYDHFGTSFCFVGHTHIPSLFRLEVQNDRVITEMTRVDAAVALLPRTIVNPGSVGQPRDRDARAAYAIYDDVDHSWEERRASYNFAEVQQRIREVGLPEKHAVRLAEGW